jgi:hypothetical protein
MLVYPEVDGQHLLDQMKSRVSSLASPASRSTHESSSAAALNNTPQLATVSGRYLLGSSAPVSASSESFVRSPPASAAPQSPVRVGPVVDPVESRTYVNVPYATKEETKLYVL